MKFLSKGYVNIGAVEKSIYFWGRFPYWNNGMGFRSDI